MFLDKWINDISDITIKYFGDKDNNASLYSNLLLYKLINSYVWEGEFKGNKLYISNDDDKYSYIKIPEYFDPDDNFDIREEIKFNVLEHKYKDTNYYYNFLDMCEYNEDYMNITDEEIDLMFWDKADISKGFYVYNDNIKINDKIMLNLIEALKLKDDKNRPYYSILLEDNIVKQKKNKEDLFNNIEYVIYNNSIEIEKYTKMGDFYSGNTKKVLGHRYYDDFDTNRFYIVAQNKICPIGIICVFDHSSENVLDEDNNRWSLSYISVSPTYRNKGISKNLLRKLIKHAIDNEKYIFRTDSSELGQKYIFETYSNIAKKEFPEFPFIPYYIGRTLSRVTHLYNFSNADYKEKCQILNSLFEKLLETASPDLFYFDRNLVDEYIENESKKNIVKI